MQLPRFQYVPPYNLPPQPPQPKSNSKSLMECFIAIQIKINEAFGELINQLISKFDTMQSHQKIMDT